MDHDAIIAEVLASGLRGRGGAGFPTGIKWRTVRDYHAVRAALDRRGERRRGRAGHVQGPHDHPHRPLRRHRGCADRGPRRRGRRGRDRDQEVVRSRGGTAAGRGGGGARGRLGARRAHRRVRGTRRVPLRRGDGAARGARRPLSVPAHRAALPPWRTRAGRDLRRRPLAAATSSSHVEMAGPGDDAPPTLVDNVETMANVPRIIAAGRRGSAPRAPSGHRARSCARSSATSSARASAR